MLFRSKRRLIKANQELCRLVRFWQEKNRDDFFIRKAESLEKTIAKLKEENKSLQIELGRREFNINIRRVK